MKMPHCGAAVARPGAQRFEQPTTYQAKLAIWPHFSPRPLGRLGALLSQVTLESSMNARVYPGPNTIPTTNDVVNADANKAGTESTSMNREHRTGDTVDKGDQVSSVTLLGFAVAGSAVMLGAHWLVG
jgi:hypothetical protein